ncbi:hypothetical protein ACJX0J_020106, partial [Zea mays]
MTILWWIEFIQGKFIFFSNKITTQKENLHFLISSISLQPIIILMVHTAIILSIFSFTSFAGAPHCTSGDLIEPNIYQSMLKLDSLHGLLQPYCCLDVLASQLSNIVAGWQREAGFGNCIKLVTSNSDNITMNQSLLYYYLLKAHGRQRIHNILFNIFFVLVNAPEWLVVGMEMIYLYQSKPEMTGGQHQVHQGV